MAKCTSDKLIDVGGGVLGIQSRGHVSIITNKQDRRLFIPYTVGLPEVPPPPDENYSIDLERSSEQYLYINDADCPTLQFSGDLTFEFWVKHESLPGENVEQFYTTKSPGTGGGEGPWRLHIEGGAGGALKIIFAIFEDRAAAIDDTCERFWTVTDTIDVGVWHHIAVTCDIGNSNATKFVLYIDGVSQGNGTNVFGTSCASIFNSNGQLTIARSIFSDPSTDTIDGKIDDFRMWNTVRSEAEIQTNMNTEIAAQTGLRGYWKFNNDLTDSSGNGNTLTASGSPVFVLDSPF